MEFRSPAAAAATNAKVCEYLTQNLSDPINGRAIFDTLLADLGNAIDSYPDWHPILTLPQHSSDKMVYSLSQIDAYKGKDHTRYFVRGFVTCPYSLDTAEQLVTKVNAIPGLEAYRLDSPLYSDHAYPVVVQAIEIELEADGTIRSRDALAWSVQQMLKHARDADVAETWWNMRSSLLGEPNGSRSSLLVNQFTGGHMRKILEALNNSGLFGPIKESSLEMLSEKKRKSISETLIRAALNAWNRKDPKFVFELRGEQCKAEISDTWKDGVELAIRVMIGNFDLYTSGFYYKKGDRLETVDPKGKKALAEKFL